MATRLETREMRIELSKGAVVFWYPGQMTAEDLQDWKDTMSILFRSLDRRFPAHADNDMAPLPMAARLYNSR